MKSWNLLSIEHQWMFSSAQHFWLFKREGTWLVEHLSARAMVFRSLLIHLFVCTSPEVKYSNFPYSPKPSGHLHSSSRRGKFEMPIVQDFPEGFSSWTPIPGWDGTWSQVCLTVNSKADKCKKQLALRKVVPKLFHIYSIRSYFGAGEYSSLVYHLISTHEAADSNPKVTLTKKLFSTVHSGENQHYYRWFLNRTNFLASWACHLLPGKNFPVKTGIYNQQLSKLASLLACYFLMSKKHLKQRSVILDSDEMRK